MSFVPQLALGRSGASVCLLCLLFIMKCAVDSEPGALADASSAVLTQRKGARSRSVSRSSSEKRLSRHGPPGGSLTTGAKFLNFKLPIGPQVKPPLLSPGYFRGYVSSHNKATSIYIFVLAHYGISIVIGWFLMGFFFCRNNSSSEEFTFCVDKVWSLFLCFSITFFV